MANSFLDTPAVQSPQVMSPTVQGPAGPAAPAAPGMMPLEGYSPPKPEVEEDQEPSFFADLLSKARSSRLKEAAEERLKEADELFGQDAITVSDLKKFNEAAEDLEDLSKMAETTAEKLDDYYVDYLESAYDIPTIQAKALSDYFTSDDYVPGDIPKLQEAMRPSADFVGPMGPTYVGQTFTPVEAVRPSPDFIGPMPVGSYAAEAVRPSADFIGPMPQEIMSASEFEAAQKAAEKAAALGQSKEKVVEAIEAEVSRVETAKEFAKKTASVTAAIIALDDFVDDPNLQSGLVATGATASAVAAVTSLPANVAGPPTATAAISSKIASVVNPILTFYAGVQIFKALTYDKDYYRSQGYITYDNGNFNISKVRGADGGRSDWADGQTKAAQDNLNMMVNDYGFKVDEKVANEILSTKGLIMNNYTYGKKMGGRDASLNAGELIYAMIVKGGLKITEDTPAEIAETPLAFLTFIGDVQKDAQDKYAAYMYDEYGGLEDYRRTGSKSPQSKRVINKKYAAFGREETAQAYADSWNADPSNASVTLTKTKRRGKAGRVKYTSPHFSKTVMTVKQKEIEAGREGSVFSGGYSLSPKTLTYDALTDVAGATKKVDGFAVFNNKDDALAAAAKLNAEDSSFTKTVSVRRGKAYRRKETKNYEKDYQVGSYKGQYYIGSTDIEV